MCNVPTIEQRNYEWLHNHADNKADELELIVNTRLMPEWEARGYTLPDVNAFREKMNEEDLPGESAVLGTRKPGDRKSRRKATAKAKRHLADIYPLTDSVRKVGNGYIKVSGDGEVKVGSTDICRVSKYKKEDRRKTRHEGKELCRVYDAEPEILSSPASPIGLRETFPEYEDGSIDVDAYIFNKEQRDAHIKWQERKREIEMKCLLEMETFTFPCLIFVSDWYDVQWGVSRDFLALGVVDSLEEGRTLLFNYFEMVFRGDGASVSSAPLKGISFVGGVSYYE